MTAQGYDHPSKLADENLKKINKKHYFIYRISFSDRIYQLHVFHISYSDN